MTESSNSIPKPRQIKDFIDSELYEEFHLLLATLTLVLYTHTSLSGKDILSQMVDTLNKEKTILPNQEKTIRVRNLVQSQMKRHFS